MVTRAYLASPKAYQAKYHALAEWYLENQTKLDWDEADVKDLAEEIDVAIDAWLSERASKCA